MHTQSLTHSLYTSQWCFITLIYTEKLSALSLSKKKNVSARSSSLHVYLSRFSRTATRRSRWSVQGPPRSRRVERGLNKDSLDLKYEEPFNFICLYYLRWDAILAISVAIVPGLYAIC